MAEHRKRCPWAIAGPNDSVTIRSVDIDEFIFQARSLPVFDVRTPAEYAQGHIPRAIPLPLFSDEERSVIGTAYVKQGRQSAVKAGLDLVGPRMRGIIETVESTARTSELLIHCWRGGMRSGAVSWLLGFYGYNVRTLTGGYKSFRRFALDSFDRSRKIIVVGGRTGSGKTATLHELARLGESIIDLEALACHRGSTFGALGQKEKPTQEQFENDLAFRISETDNDPIWLEDEGKIIGHLSLPRSLVGSMQNATLIFLDIPRYQRVAHLIAEYGHFPVDELSDSIVRIQKRLGGLEARRALDALASGDLQTTCEIVLAYYDRAYDYQLSKHDPSRVFRVASDSVDPIENASIILATMKEKSEHR